MGRFWDLTGMVFGRLTVVSFVNERKNGKYAWLCKCECGNLKIIRDINLRNGETKSCGCLKRERMRIVQSKSWKHGLTNTRIYGIWFHMRDRCNNPKNSYYHCYGGRGIKVCDDWNKDFQSFYNWAMSNGYSDDLTIERKDVNGNYEPDNCCWIPGNEQWLNRRTTHNITINGITKPLTMWANEYGLKPHNIYNRLRHGWTGEDLLKPVDKRFTNSGGKGRKMK
jgi:hypothetical protein